jgi:alpha-glucosidase (family GH31 glycosyl hydrolase)
MKRLIKILLLGLSLVPLYAWADTLHLKLEQGEYWWGGLSAAGFEMPYDASSKVAYDLWGDNYGNQVQPLLLSSKGRYVWSEQPIRYEFDLGQMTVTTRQGKILSGVAGSNLPAAYDYASKTFFPPDGKIPEALMFTRPQYNTWIELQYDQNEKGILKYARDIIDNGYPPGVLMIDDNWQENYGTWEFSARRFQDPRGMIQQLHTMGFKVMLWVCPFVSADSPVFRELSKKGLLLRESRKPHLPAIVRWWNGASACLDLSNPAAQTWFKDQLNHLMNAYGVDGFKFDAGDSDFYTGDILTSDTNAIPNEQTRNYAELGLDYPLNEYRASWKMAGMPLAQRLRDKKHCWEDLRKLIPDQMSQSVMGYAYTCPDMIGGGELHSFLDDSTIDQELVVRSAEVQALMPMMQFSVAPWRVLSRENNHICREMAKLHVKMGEKILTLAKEASQTGEPIVQPMAMAFPNGGYEKIKDQFVLGHEIIVAPVLEKGARIRSVLLPPGQWKADDGKIYDGGKQIAIPAPLERLPYFTLQRQPWSAAQR